MAYSFAHQQTICFAFKFVPANVGDTTVHEWKKTLVCRDAGIYRWVRESGSA
jgi:hypothetical protein